MQVPNGAQFHDAFVGDKAITGTLHLNPPNSRPKVRMDRMTGSKL
ncbi:hypothetical protein PWR63_18455 [Paraburkholderia sp. A2WS-5]